MLNSFTGKIPNAVASLPRLQVLQLWSNQLSGEIPNYLGTQSDLTILDLSMNNLSGKIPDELCHSGHQVTLGLFSNSLQGKIPRSLNTCKSLEDIHHRQNRLGNDEGIVELDMFSNLPNLRFLDLSYNGVSVSSSINSSYTWPNLQYLSLASCSLKEFPRFLKGSKHLMKAHDELQTVTSFVLKGALIGYGCGLPVGVVIGYVAVKTGRAKWLLKLAQGKCH
ncbi:hypothetical protein Godav_028847 [Gossypium davidsonii]|uniref:Leucine-rich repeat-containing N-terminal plant-type domain-containing protein n=1 Tax=Gossypium davidsonii TaxID=34287 RepID=A0A7J8TGZ8_GOSDV|nr:hypothetical protein [Gossypium davidsonii]